MTPSAPRTLAVELRPHCSTHWAATYYPMVATPAGRWADVTWALHQHLLPNTDHPREPARWLETRSPDSDHPCYAGHRGWATQLAAGYTAALAAYDAEPSEEPLWLEAARQLHDATIVVPAGQLSEWVLDDLQEATSRARD
ncbi:hypothetical protein [Kocuria arenosa]|uniref:hypothetical protein n=1 Tax=Kocuria arenosa TaxID=3071446 RepID=UPI0034D3C4D3